MEKWTLIIKPKTSWFDLHLKDIWTYRDLLLMFVKRDFIAVYKQTILGPLWFLIQPLLTTIMFILVFDKVANIPTDSAPPALFYLSGLVIWNYFSSCLNKTSVTAGIFGKVYFPRLIIPLSNVVSALIGFAIQLLLLLILIAYYVWFLDSNIQLNTYLIFIPFLLLLVAALGLGVGIIISSLTTKYRDMIRYSLLGVGEFHLWHLLYSTSITFLSLLIGVLIFNRIEKSFMDVV